MGVDRDQENPPKRCIVRAALLQVCEYAVMVDVSVGVNLKPQCQELPQSGAIPGAAIMMLVKEQRHKRYGVLRT